MGEISSCRTPDTTLIRVVTYRQTSSVSRQTTVQYTLAEPVIAAANRTSGCPASSAPTPSSFGVAAAVAVATMRRLAARPGPAGGDHPVAAVRAAAGAPEAEPARPPAGASA